MRRLPRIISGGQTGVDQAALRAARGAGLQTGGSVPRGWLTESGPAPWLADFGLRELPSDDYPSRTRSNVRDSDATLWLGATTSNGGRLTCGTARRSGKPLFVAEHLSAAALTAVAEWLESLDELTTLNVAGVRESTTPGIGSRAEQFLTQLFGLLRSRAWVGAS